MGSICFLCIGFALDVVTAQELVVAILYNAPIAFSGLSSSRRLPLYIVLGALFSNIVAGILNAQAGVDAVAILNRVISGLSFLLVGFMTLALRRSLTQLSALQASEVQAAREHNLHDFTAAMGGTLKPDALLQHAAEVLRGHLGARAVVITGLEQRRYSAPQFSSPPEAIFRYARLGDNASWVIALAQQQDPPVAAGLDDAVPVLAGVLAQPVALVTLVVGAEETRATLFLGDILRELGNLLERAQLLDNLDAQRRELARRNGVIRDLVYAFSHDLRTPLMANAMNMRLALEGAYGELSADYRGVLKNGLEANEDLLELADSLLMVARSRAARPNTDLLPKLSIYRLCSSSRSPGCSR